jgi:predicted permease
MGNDVAIDVGIDGTVLSFTVFVSLLTGTLCGFFPSINVARSDLIATLKDAPSGFAKRFRHFNLRSALLISQVSLSLLLLVGTGLFIRSLQNAQAIEPGFDPDNLLLMSLNINLLSYTQAQGAAFYRQVVETVEAIPGIQSAALARIVPLSGNARTVSILIDEQETSSGPPVRSESTGRAAGLSETRDIDPRNLLNLNVVSPQYFQTMRIPLLRGRDFGAEDVAGGSRVAIINESMAGRFWPGEDAIGKRFRTAGQDAPVEVIGVVRDSKYISLGEDSRVFAYLPLAQNHESGMSLHVRTNVASTSVISAVRSAIRRIEPNLPLVDVRTMNAQIGTTLFPARLAAALLGVFGLFALLLASVGLYGVMSYFTARRTQEIGIRMALGARRSDVLRLVFKEAFILVAVGIAIGLATAQAVTRFLQGFLYGISTTDPLTFLAVSVILAASAWIATFTPALRAVRVNPVIAIRHE